MPNLWSNLQCRRERHRPEAEVQEVQHGSRGDRGRVGGGRSGGTTPGEVGRGRGRGLRRAACQEEERQVRARRRRPNPLVAIGGIPTILFAFGVFLVIVFTSLPIIGGAGTRRANASVDKLKLE